MFFTSVFHQLAIWLAGIGKKFESTLKVSWLALMLLGSSHPTHACVDIARDHDDDDDDDGYSFKA